MMPQTVRILIADDESIIRMNLREMLTQHGYEVIAEASNGKTAIELANKLKPDLVMMDIKMPGIDGVTAAAELVSNRVAPVVLLTAYSERSLIGQAKEAGVSGYLVKPVRDTELTPVIELALARYHQFLNLEQQVSDLQEALETRKLVEKAKGVLMEVHGLTESDAFNRMRKTSMDHRKSLRDVAEAILLAHDVESGSR
jgi:AmiR/NasT family two-component response regulator